MIKIELKRQDQYLEMSLTIDNPFRDNSLLQAKSGKVNYRYFLQELAVSSHDRVIFSAQFSPLMAANPVLSFRAKHIAKGDTLQVKWQDNLGKSGSSNFNVNV